jgi:hypothetical protein
MPQRAIASGVLPLSLRPSKLISPPLGDEQPHQRAHRRGLAHAVAAEQGDDLALADVEADIEQHLAGAIGRLQVAHAQHQASPSPR